MVELDNELPFGELDENTEVADNTGLYADFDLEGVDPHFLELEMNAQINLDGEKISLSKVNSEYMLNNDMDMKPNMTVFYQPNEDNQFLLNLSMKDEGEWGSIRTSFMSAPISEGFAEELMEKYSDGTWDYVE